MSEIIFKTELIKGAKGDRGEAGQADSIPTDGVIAFQGETVPDGYEETDPGGVFDEVYEDINAVKDMISDEYDATATYNAGDFCTHENGLYKCTATTTGLWDNSKWVLTSAGDEIKANAAATEATQDMISDAYDVTAAYTVGDYCIYNDTLYKCNTAIATGEAFTPAKWDATNVGNELKKSKSYFTPLIGNSTGVESRNFYVTDEKTFIDVHFCVKIEQGVGADAAIMLLPTYAQNKDICYSVAAVSGNNPGSYIVYSYYSNVYLEDRAIAPGGTDDVFAGSIRISLL